jgi:hypothetical protein
LADEEKAADPGNRRDLWLRAYADKGQFCLGGGLNEHFIERFLLPAQKGGMALDLGPASKAAENFIGYVFHDARDHKSKLLRGATPDGSGWISRICEASAVTCARLERQAREAVRDNARSKRRHEKKSRLSATSQRTKAAVVRRRSIKEQEPTVPTFAQSPDYRTIKYNGKDYELTEKQAMIVQVLHDAWQRGMPSVPKSTLLAAIEAETSRVLDYFRGSPLWKTLVVSAGRRGMYKLSLPRKTSPSQ